MRTLTAFTVCCLSLNITLNTNAEDADAGVLEPRTISADAVRVERVDGKVRAARAGRRDNDALRGDANDDGVVDRDEFRGKDEHFDKIDADGDGQLTKEECKSARKARRSKHGKKRFEKQDANSNGVIDRDEFRGKDQKFAKMDADGNGELTHEEIKAAHKARRVERGERGERGEGSKGRDRRGGDRDDGGDI